MLNEGDQVNCAPEDNAIDDDAESEEKQLLPNLKKGEQVQLTGSRIKEGMTKKPALLTEATLLKAMETAGKQLDDPEAVQAMKDCGLGTPATRANIIETLYKRAYIVNEKNKLLPTDIGMQVYELTSDLPIGNPALTGEWEKKLNLMAKGEYEVEAFYQEIIQFTKTETARLLNDGKTVQTGTIEGIKCPVCGGRIKETEKAFGCLGYKDGCKFVLWKDVAKKKLTEKHLRQIIENGMTDVIKGFTSKAGKPFDARLKYSPEQQKMVFDFTPEQIGQCPVCGKEIIEGKRGFGCSGYKDGCTFVIWKEQHGKQLSSSQVTRLLQGESIALKNFVREDGTTFDGKLKLEQTDGEKHAYKVTCTENGADKGKKKKSTT